MNESEKTRKFFEGFKKYASSLSGTEDEEYSREYDLIEEAKWNPEIFDRLYPEFTRPPELNRHTSWQDLEKRRESDRDVNTDSN